MSGETNYPRPMRCPICNYPLGLRFQPSCPFCGTKFHYTTRETNESQKDDGNPYQAIIAAITSGVTNNYTFKENEQMENNMNIGFDNCAEIANAAPKEPVNHFKSTVPLMLSSDYVDRFVAEYRQLKIRYERLKAFNNKIEAARITCCEGKKVEEPKHDCSYDVLLTQQRIMGEYLHILEVRAVVEDISLLEV